jgi:hypothetical protein
MKINDKYQLALEALKKIDEIVGSDIGEEADCFVVLDYPLKKEPNLEMVKMWAESLVEIYKITHPLLNKCCGGKLCS